MEQMEEKLQEFIKNNEELLTNQTAQPQHSSDQQRHKNAVVCQPDQSQQDAKQKQQDAQKKQQDVLQDTQQKQQDVQQKPSQKKDSILKQDAQQTKQNQEPKQQTKHQSQQQQEPKKQTQQQLRQQLQHSKSNPLPTQAPKPGNIEMDGVMRFVYRQITELAKNCLQMSLKRSLSIEYFCELTSSMEVLLREVGWVRVLVVIVFYAFFHYVSRFW